MGEEEKGKRDGGEKVEVEEGEDDESEVSSGDHVGYEKTMMMVRALSCRRTLILYSPIVVHHLSLDKDDFTHLVYLTSTTYSSLKILDDPDPPLFASFTFITIVISTWDLMDNLDNLPSSTTSSSATTKKPYFLSRSLAYHQEALLSFIAASTTIQKRMMIPCNMGG